MFCNFDLVKFQRGNRIRFATVKLQKNITTLVRTKILHWFVHAQPAKLTV